MGLLPVLGYPPEPCGALLMMDGKVKSRFICIYIYVQNMYNMVGYLCVSYISDCVYHAHLHIYTNQVGA